MNPNTKDDRALELLAGRARPASRDERWVAELGRALRAAADKRPPMRSAPPPTPPLPSEDDAELPDVDESLLGELESPFSAEEVAAQQAAAQAGLQQDFELEVLAGRMTPFDEATRQIGLLREALLHRADLGGDDVLPGEADAEAQALADEKLELPPDYVINPHANRTRAISFANCARYLCHAESWRDIESPSRMPIPGTRVNPGEPLGYDFSFAREKISRGIYIIVSADWTEHEIRHPLAVRQSFDVIRPRPILDVLSGLAEMLYRDACNHPGEYPLELSIVTTMAERRRERRSSVPRLRVKAQRADFVVADLSASTPEAAQARDFELGMLSMADAFEQRTLLMRRQSDPSTPFFHEGKFLEYSSGSRIDVERELREHRRSIFNWGRPEFREIMEASLEDAIIRALLPFYLQLRLTASSRGMISDNPRTLQATRHLLHDMGQKPISSVIDNRRMEMSMFRLPDHLFED